MEMVSGDKSTSEQHQQQHQQHQHHTATSGGKRAVLKNFKLSNPYVKAALVYLLVALVVFYPITLNMAGTAPGTGGDTYQNLWDIWWVNYATFNLHSSVYSTTLIDYPVGANLAFQTMPPLFAYISAPFQGVSIPFAYNILFFSGFVIAGLGMFALADYITKNKYAAFFAGIIFSFSAFHIAQGIAHIEWISIGFAPLAILFFLKLIKEERKYRNAVWLAVSFSLIILMEGVESMLMASMFLFFVFLAYLINPGTRHFFKSIVFWKGLGIAIVIVVLLSFWALIPIVRAIMQPGGLTTANYLNSPALNEISSPDLLSFFLPSYYNGIFNGVATSGYLGIYANDPTERVSYIGYVALAFAAYGAFKYFKKSKGVKLWVVLGIGFFLLSLGPNIQIAGNVTPVPGLYPLYSSIPVLSVIREPGRFDLYVTLITALLAAIGMGAFLEKRKEKGVSNLRLTTIAFSVLFLIESAGIPLSSSFAGIISTPVSVPQLYPTLAQIQANFTVFSLPAFPTSNTGELYIAQEMYYLSQAHKPLVGGYTSRQNSTQELSLYNIPLGVEAANLQQTGSAAYPSPVLENYTAETIFTLYNYNSGLVILNERAYTTQELNVLARYLQSVFGSPVYTDNTTAAFSTYNAINNSVYRNYIAYPQFNDWTEVQAQPPASAGITPTTIDAWVPTYPGEIIVYAPFANNSNIRQKLQSGVSEPINTTIELQAFSETGIGSLIVADAVGNRTVKLADFNLTNHVENYTIDTVLFSGTQPNILLFVPQQPIASNQTPIGIMNITFTRRP